MRLPDLDPITDWNFVFDDPTLTDPTFRRVDPRLYVEFSRSIANSEIILFEFK